jgi:UDP-4-amino-4-deoxy-L-arabinose-oxoglutarate aminotransferase
MRMYSTSNRQASIEQGSNEFLPYTRPATEPSDIEAVVKVLESGWIASGIKVRELEEAFRNRTGAKHAVAVSSATAGMLLILHALGIGPGDEVITPSMTWVSTVNLIRLCGATPVFVDVDRDTLMTEAQSIERKITRNTRLIVPVHFGGAPLELGPIRWLADDHGISVVEDAAHALGTNYLGVPIGCTGTCVFSFQAFENVSTAEGGVICTDDDGLAEHLRRLRFHGFDSDPFDWRPRSRPPEAEVVEPGFKCNLPDVTACLALGQLARLDETITKRGMNARRYIEAFKETGAIKLLNVPEWVHKHSWHLFVVRLEIDHLRIGRDQFRSELMSLGIGTGLHFRAVHHYKYYRSLECPGQYDLPNTDWNTDRLVTLPLFHDMSDAEFARVVDSVRLIIGKSAK